jgi:aldose 1-epimerase
VRYGLSFWLGLGILTAVLGCGDSKDPDDSGVSVPQPNIDQVEAPMMRVSIQKDPFGELKPEADEPGYPITRYILNNENGVSVGILDFGAIIQSVSLPDKAGKKALVTLGFDKSAGYTNTGENADPYFGAICGRFSNRIAQGKFTLDGQEYQLATNNAPNHLHGGKRGFNDVLWQARELPTDDKEAAIELTYVSQDGEEGYTGQLTVKVVYSLNNANELKIDYTASTTKATPLNLTNHCYWNLSGVGYGEAAKNSDSILEHQLTLNCDRFLPVDETLIPTGELKPVTGTPMDFSKPTAVGSRFDQLPKADPIGYDHCFLRKSYQGPNQKPELIARMTEPKSGRVMEILTTEPAVQFYTGNFLKGGASDGGFPQHHGFCLECQHLPDSPNQKYPAEYNAILQPGEVYQQTTIHRFSWGE